MMQTRTAVVITIGDVIESRPPRRKISAIDKKNHNDSCLFDEDGNSNTMKVKTSGVVSTTMSNGYNEFRKTRLSSSDCIFSKTRSNVKHEIDEEISFSDPRDDLSLEKPMKKKRKSFNERFLEDNSEYYGFQISHSEGRQRHKSDSQAEDKNIDAQFSKVRKRAASSSWCLQSKHESSDDECFDKKSTRKSRLSPKSRKRRSELDKLLEAGSSSFHFETAKETATRLGNELSPIHIDVDENADVVKEESSVEESEDELLSKKRKKVLSTTTLLRESSSVNGNRKKAKGRGRWMKTSNQSVPKTLFRQVEHSSPTEVENLFDDLEARLLEIDGSEADIESMEFSFERTPMRESWFLTYSRQDQGDEILFFPESKSFPLPYEMPISTFYPRKDGPGGRTEKRGRKSKFNSTEASSAASSVAPSGTATPVEEESEQGVPEYDPWSRLAPPPPSSVVSKKTRGKRDFQNATNVDKASNNFLNKFGPRTAAAVREFSRKSPRGHASTRSLISAGSEFNDIVHLDSLQNSVAASPHILDECSNDSTMSRFSNVAVPPQEVDNALLDNFLRQMDPDLSVCDVSLCSSPVPDNESDSKKKTKLRSGDRKNHRHQHRQHRRSKDLTSPVAIDDPMDRLVAISVDEILLDCLEDELPSVPIDGELPGSTVFELLQNYETCDAMALSSSKKTRPRPFLRTPSTSSNSTVDTKIRKPCSSVRTLSRRLSSPKTQSVVEMSEGENSASETLSVTSSVQESSRVEKLKLQVLPISCREKNKISKSLKVVVPAHKKKPLKKKLRRQSESDDSSSEQCELSTSKSLKLVVRKPQLPPRREVAAAGPRRPIKIPVRKKVDSDEETDDEVSSDVEEEEEVPLRESQRLRTKKFNLRERKL